MRRTTHHRHCNQISVKVDAKIVWQVALDRDTKHWIGECEPLDIVLEASSQSKLRTLIAHSMNVLFRFLLAEDRLEHFLNSKGWKMHGLSSKLDNPEHVKFDVPFELISVQQKQHVGRSVSLH